MLVPLWLAAFTDAELDVSARTCSLLCAAGTNVGESPFPIGTMPGLSSVVIRAGVEAFPVLDVALFA